MSYPAHFPELPETPATFNWSPDVLKAHGIINSSYTRAVALLQQEDGDPLRLRVHSDGILSKLVPLLEALVPEVGDDDWIALGAHSLGKLMVQLERSAIIADGREHAKVNNIDRIRVERTSRGRPRKVVEPVWLADAVSSHRRITLQALADALGIHRNTLRNYLKMYRVYNRYSDISDHDLDILTRRFKQIKPSSGLRYLIGFLRTHGLKVQKERVRKSLCRIDGLGQVLRKHAIARRDYYAPRPNAVWHMDGHHKMIRWGIVIHGIADGYDRMVVGLHAANNNRASTVLRYFLEAVQRWGAPSRMRGDRGGENIEVSVWMIRYRGPNRGSFLWGTSTRNTRIERLWVEVGSQFARRWRGFFLRLERLHQLNADNPHHLWLLHYLFLDEINADCQEFQAQWNHHPISGKGKNQAPVDMRFEGELKYGKYIDNFDEVQAELVEHYGAQDLDSAIAGDQDRHIRHDAIEVADNQSPFESSEALGIFSDILKDVSLQGIIPTNFGVAQSEWEGNSYGETEFVKVGRKDVEIALPFDIWWPRAVLWAQGMEIMIRMQEA
ncbi:Integrase catalytic domain-containing protein [Favolaschia claudopus]|uniref:Integrase catalytic domain-containing protein n=1 Tax=Favolaschia claudopus TaxID=2862362 RepID=A0AAV9ZIF0_9AGAR